MDRDRHEERSAQSKGLLQEIRDARLIAQPAAFSLNITDRPYRAVSIYLSIILAKTSVTPNQITAVWIILGLAGVVALAAPQYSIRLIGAILLEISYLFDYVDGEVARLQRRYSKRGLFLDLAGHGLIKTALFLGIGFRVMLQTGQSEFLVLAILACVGVANGHAAVAHAGVAGVSMQRKSDSGLSTTSSQTRRSIFRELLNLFGYAFESFGIFGIVLIGAAANRLAWVLIFFGTLGPFWCIYRLTRFRFD